MNKCTPKDLARFKRYRENNREKVALFKKKYYDDVLSSTIRGLCMRIRKDCRNRAVKRKLDFNITTEYLLKLLEECNYTCPVFKNKFIIDSKEKDRNFKASLDRIDNSKGYIEGNVMWISWKANTMKSNATKKELKMFAEWVMNEKTQ
tara:strand:- start:49 stop:492 length:444 start_codon:yes stop_codon:yes gene_type:complete